jgi:transcriptional regulator with XRE-family HTH domain
MKDFGMFLSNLRSSASLSQEEVALLVETSRSTISRLENKEEVEPLLVQAVPVHYTATLGGRIVVGHEYGEEQNPLLTSRSLYGLASLNACYLMQLADVKCFAVDDCILLTNSKDFEGWEPHDIKTTILTTPLPIPDDLDELRREKISTIEKDYFNSPHYRLVSATPAFSDLDYLKITLAPIHFYDYYSLEPFFDEPLLAALDGSKVSIRQKYANTALTYSSTDRGTSLIPAPVSIQCVVVTKDDHIVLTKRSFSVAFYPNHWSASFEETMNAPSADRKGKPMEGDADFFAGAIRGLQEELAIPACLVESIKVLSLNVEYLTLSVDVITLMKVNLTREEIEQNRLLKAWHREEASDSAWLSTDLDTVIEKLFSRTLWHPTSRMRLLQFLFHTYGIHAVEKAFKERISRESAQ